MTYESPYGKMAGLRERIDDWMEKFAQDKTYPWVGTGLIDDLEAVARYMDGEREDTEQVVLHNTWPYGNYASKEGGWDL